MYQTSGGRNGYQLHPPRVWFVPQVLPQVETVHVLVDKTEGVVLSRVYPHKWYYAHVLLVEEGPHVNLVVKPLGSG